jgi:uncharacterized protein YndB with AHSA1/START domain
MSVTEQISASPEVVWNVLIDINDWPNWTQSVRTAQRLEEGPLGVGSRARLKQPGMPTLVWEVSELAAPSVFTWRARSPGVSTTAIHRLEPGPEGGTTLTLEVEHSGPLAGLVGALTSSRTRRYIGMEAAGLKKASEARPSS